MTRRIDAQNQLAPLVREAFEPVPGAARLRCYEIVAEVAATAPGLA